MLDQYSKQEAIGYMILALQELGKSEEEIKEIINEVKQSMNVWTEVYAEQVHDKLYEI